ncbi:ROK family protein [Bifidobacterium sp. ESL0775]|uniref:ROK family protein n=1 Tax=Bifidobacterium sp. ESL0775 TaxID=2983230 RepID=UPI0023F7D0EC|nr:ROK family protein [Bifidobacterium sp. ESL0775]WEV69211.1 ROK family protein [Bifidobacterium sp. ESL0775]
MRFLNDDQNQDRFDAHSSKILAFDIGGTKLAAGIVNESGECKNFTSIPTQREDGPKKVIPRLLKLGEQVMGDEKGIRAIGISCGGPLNANTGVLIGPPHLPGWTNIAITQIATNHFGLPAYLDNDATAAALGEAWYGAGASASSMIYLTISTGVGGGIVIDGRPYRGATGNGGELGHITVRPGGRLCSCKRHGCLEAYCSGRNIARRAQIKLDEASSLGQVSSLSLIDDITAADVSRETAAGDWVASTVWNETTSILGQALTDLVNAFEPEVAILGGGVTRAGAMLLDPVRAIVKENAMEPIAQKARIVLASLGDEVGVIGAGAIAFDRLGITRSDILTDKEERNK